MNTMNAWEAVKPVLLNRWTLTAAGAVVFTRFLIKASMGVCTSKRRLDGLTALITGANTGIGLETARDLARRGARVLLACRDQQRGLSALEAVRDVASVGATVELVSLDLASLDSVRACAEKIVASEPRLDILINNAGAAGLGPEPTRDGLNPVLQANHFGPFLLTLLLVDLLRKSAPSRIVFVSSRAHTRADPLSPELLDHERAKALSTMPLYSVTKLCNVLNSNELARKLQGTGVTVNSLHPGLVSTDFFRFAPRWLQLLVSVPLGIFSKNTVEGAQTTIHVAVSEDLEGVTGRYFSDCKEIPTAKQAQDEALARAIWKKSEELVKLTDQERPNFPN